MMWSRKFPDPLRLKDGRVIVTLAEARDLMLTLPQDSQTNPYWRGAADLLMQAAYRGRQTPIQDVGAQLARAFRADGLM